MIVVNLVTHKVAVKPELLLTNWLDICWLVLVKKSLAVPSVNGDVFSTKKIIFHYKSVALLI